MKERLFVAAVTQVITRTNFFAGRPTTLNLTINGEKV